MKVDWIVSADSCAAHIYSIPAAKYKEPMTLIKELQHPEGRMKGQELASDGPGHYRARDKAAGKFADPTDPKTAELDKFVKEIADAIEHGRSINAFEKIIIVAAPHFYGLIAMHLSDHSKKLIQHISHKDRMHNTAKELHDFIQAELLPGK